MLFTTASNVVSPWHANWAVSPQGSIWTLQQLAGDSAGLVGGANVSALHVLFHQLRDGAGSDNNSFAASLYADGSVRLRYISVANVSEIAARDFLGLWGAVATSNAQTATFTRYHLQNLTSSVAAVDSGLDVAYCPFSAVACIPESCVSPSDSLRVRWNGTDSCSALGANSTVALWCEWAGGIASTAATLVTSNSSAESSTLVCAVPELDLADGEVLFVDIVMSAASSASGDTPPGSTSVMGVAVGSNGTELARTNLQVRYYAANATRLNCGCSALPEYAGQTCDSMSVCGGDNSTKDCADTPFGSAFVSACGQCTAGLTGITPVFACGTSGSSGSGGFLNLISQTIILLMIICCMTFITSTVSFSIRRMLANRQAAEQLNENDFLEDYADVMRGAPGATAARGLSEFECDALGQIVFTKEFYVAHKKAQLESIHGVQGVATSAEGEVSPASSNTNCDCPICLMDILEGNVCRALPDPCGHIFHMACIDQWFRQSTSCPLCKRNMKAILEGTDEDDDHQYLQYTGSSNRPAYLRYPPRNEHEEDTPTARSIAALERIRTTLFNLTANSAEHRAAAASHGAGYRGPGDYSNSNSSSSSAAAGNSSATGVAMTRLAFERAALDEHDAAVRNRDRGTYDL